MSIAVMFVSESELALADPAYQTDWIETNKDYLWKLLDSLGMDTSADIDFQEVTQHRNRMNKLVTCRRFAGFERTDKAWIESGYASREAKNAASGSKMLGNLVYGEVIDYRNDNAKVGITVGGKDE